VQLTRVAAPFVLVVLLIPLVAVAQPRSDMPRIGFLQAYPSANDLYFKAFKEKLQELGHVEDQTIAIDYRSAEGKYNQLPALAAELVGRNVNVLMVDGGTPSITAARKATQTIPTVFCCVADPVAQGIVASLARPGGNVTGISTQHPGFAGKSLELLKEILPSAQRIAILSNPTNSSLPLVLGEMQSAARALRIEIQVVNTQVPDEFEGAFAEIVRNQPAGLVILRDALFTTEARRLTALAARHGLPTMGGDRAMPESGGLSSYGPNRLDLLRRSAVLVDKILKGAKPADLPVEQPMKFDLVINLKIAQTLGITIPPSILFQADQVIQ
jgi:putative tryptophan/tyrosine transport system substrate-binding protein